MLDEARADAQSNVATLQPLARRGVPIVGLEPSCLLTLRDEYPELVRDEAARAVARQAFLLEEFLAAEEKAGRVAWPMRRSGRVLLHGHCHQKALAGTGGTVAVLRAAGYEVGEVDAGCCGMAGSFGFEKEHYDLSVAIARRRLIPAIEAADADVMVAAPGISCRQQIEHLTARRARHPAELLWDAIR